ncbi:MAG TPA: phosphatase PAP2 family protein [Thermoanaerobaculia bacterium]|nr:phosphatase PAP2 family protein [Thermoanaerobaculia bacterium]
MPQRGEGPRRNPRLLGPLTAFLAGWLAVLGGAAPPLVAAQPIAVPAGATAQTTTPPPPESPAAPQDSGVAPQGATAPPPDTGTPPPPDATQPPEQKPMEPHDGVSAGMTAAKLLIVDVREVFRSPEHWHAAEWALFGTEVAAIVGVGAVDESLQRDVRRPKSTFADNLAKDFRTFGNYGSFEVLGGFYLGGLLAHDKRAQETTLDGLFASGIAGGLISPLLKVVIGRNRPNANQGAYNFHPFSLKVSFPSGEATQAFAVASVISTQYPNPWVELLSYTTAAITAWGRVRENGHWVSDTLAGALIGFHVGRTVVHINNRLRARVGFAPLIGPGGRHGAAMTASF